MLFPTTPGWRPSAVVACGSPPLLAGACRLWWGVSRVGVSLVVCVCGVCGCARWLCCVVCCVFVVPALLVWCGGVAWVCLPRVLVCVVACVWCGGGPWLVAPASFGLGLRLVFVWVWLVCGPGPATPGSGTWALCPATPGWGSPPGALVGPSPLLAEGRGCGSPPVLAGVYRLWWCGPARHSWLWAPGCPSPWPWCVCVCCVALRVGVGGPWGCGCRVCVCVCACGVLFVGCVIPWLVLVVGRHGRGQKAEEKKKKRSCRRVAEMCDMRNAKYIPLYLFTAHLSPCRERACAGPWGLVGCGAGAAVLPLLLSLLFFFRCVLCLVSLFFFPWRLR